MRNADAQEQGDTSDVDRPYDLVGVYRLAGRSAVSYLRLTLELDGTAHVEFWRDLGGKWSTDWKGTWRMLSGLVDIEHRHMRPIFFRARGGLHVRRIDGAIWLVPEEELASTDGYGIFEKEPRPWAALCVDPERFGHALTAGRVYLVIDEDHEHARVRIRADHGRLRWFPRACFR